MSRKIESFGFRPRCKMGTCYVVESLLGYGYEDEA